MSTYLTKLARGAAAIRVRWRSALWRRILRAPGISLGDGCQIIGEKHLHVGKDFRAGRLLWLEAVPRYRGQHLEPKLIIGKRVSCSDSVHIACAFSVTIGNDVLIGSKVHITDHNHGIYGGTGSHSTPDQPPAERPLHGAKVIIEDRVFLADGVVVLPGSVIGAGVIVGANSTVSGSLPPDTICVGTPARPIKRFDASTNMWQAWQPQESGSLPL